MLPGLRTEGLLRNLAVETHEELVRPAAAPVTSRPSLCRQEKGRGSGSIPRSTSHGRAPALTLATPLLVGRPPLWSVPLEFERLLAEPMFGRYGHHEFVGPSFPNLLRDFHEIKIVPRFMRQNDRQIWRLSRSRSIHAGLQLSGCCKRSLPVEILRRARLEGYEGGKSALYQLVASLRPHHTRLQMRFERLPRGPSQLGTVRK